jgi:hypothetical protein
MTERCAVDKKKKKKKNIPKNKGWTTIDTNSNCKPKSRTNNNTTIDSIITSIDVEFNIDTNGALEANIDSPIRKNRCIVPDKKAYDRRNTCTITKQEQQTVTKPTEEEKKERNNKYDHTRRNNKERK